MVRLELTGIRSAHAADDFLIIAGIEPACVHYLLAYPAFISDMTPASSEH